MDPLELRKRNFVDATRSASLPTPVDDAWLAGASG
jgi:hypothetical protein